MSHHLLTSLDIEDMTPKQLRKLLNGVVRSQLPYHKKTKEEQEEDAEKVDSEADAVADLHAESKGKDPIPKTDKPKLPEGVAESDNDDEVAESRKIPVKKKKV